MSNGGYLRFPSSMPVWTKQRIRRPNGNKKWTRWTQGVAQRARASDCGSEDVGASPTTLTIFDEQRIERAKKKRIRKHRNEDFGGTDEA